MITRSSPTSARTSRMALFRTPSGSREAVPSASRAAGMPKSMMPPRPSSTASAAARLRDSVVCCTTPGMEVMGLGSVRPSRMNAGRISSAGASRVSAVSRRMAGVVRRRRGRWWGKLIVLSFTGWSGRWSGIHGLVHGGHNAGRVSARRPRRPPASPSAAASAAVGTPDGDQPAACPAGQRRAMRRAALGEAATTACEAARRNLGAGSFRTQQGVRRRPCRACVPGRLRRRPAARRQPAFRRGRDSPLCGRR